jgi:chromosome segregation ATPase
MEGGVGGASSRSPGQSPMRRRAPGGMGPQGERDAGGWASRVGELPPAAGREALAVEMAGEKRLYEQELTRLRNQGAFMERQLQRVNKELRLYQLKHPATASRITKAEIDDQPDFPPWISSEEVMSPLLSAYDARIHDLESLVASQKDEMDILTERTENLVSENERLRATHIKEIDALVTQTEQGGGVGGVAMREMVGELNERINILMSENAIMADQTTALGRELDKTHEELTQRDEHTAELSNALTEAVQNVRSLEHQSAQLRMERDHLESELMAKVNALTNVESRAQDLQRALATSQGEKKSLSSQVTELRRNLSVAQRRLDAETEAMSGKVQSSAARVSELQGQYAAKAHDAESIAAELRRTRRELDAVRADAEGMLQVMTGMEKKLAEHASREEATAALALESKTKVEDALLARDQARALETQARRELTRLMEARKNDAAVAMRERDEALATLRSRLSAQIDSRERDIRELMADTTRLRVEAERMGREKESAEAMYSKLRESLDQEGDRAGSRTQLQELTGRIARAESHRESAEKQYREARQMLDQASRDFAAKEAAWKLREHQLQDALRSREAELEAIRSGMRAAVDRAEKEERTQRQLRAEIEDVRSEMERRLEDTNLNAQQELEKVRAAAAAAQASARDAQLRLGDAESGHAKALKSLRSQIMVAETKSLERVGEESQRAERLTARNADLQARCSALAAQCTELANAASDSQAETERLRSMCSEAQAKVSFLIYKKCIGLNYAMV